MSNTNSNAPKYRRAGLMDEIRGLCILCMVVYHVCFDLNYNYGVHIPIMFDSWFDIIRDIFAGAFMFICGISCRYSRNNAKRGIECFFLGMVITFVFAFFAPEAPILFGILHFMGVSMMIYAVCENVLAKIPPIIGIAVSVFLYLVSMNVSRGYIGFGDLSIQLPRELYNARLLFPFGFTSSGFAAMDYFPLFPWFFVFLAGTFFGVYAVKDMLPEFFYKTHCRFLAFCGRKTLWIYILHQPIAMGIFLLIFGRI